MRELTVKEQEVFKKLLPLTKRKTGSVRPVLKGVYFGNGYAIATNSHVGFRVSDKEFEDEFVKFEKEEMQDECKDLKYPDVSRIVDTNMVTDFQMNFDIKDLIKIKKSLAIFKKKKSPIMISFNMNRMDLLTVGDMGKHHEVFHGHKALHYNKDKKIQCVDATYFEKLLTAMIYFAKKNKDGEVTIKIYGKLNPIHIENKEKTIQGVLSPIRLESEYQSKFDKEIGKIYDELSFQRENEKMLDSVPY